MTEQEAQPKESPLAINPEQTNTIFFHSIAPAVTVTEITDFSNSFGDVSTIYPVIPNKGLCFVTYYDVRDAIKAVEQGKGHVLSGQAIGAEFAYKSRDRDEKFWFGRTTSLEIRCNTKPCQATEADVERSMSTFGEVRLVKGDSESAFFRVKYFKLNDAKHALEEGSIEIADEQFRIRVDRSADLDPTRSNEPFDRPRKHQSSNSRGPARRNDNQKRDSQYRRDVDIYRRSEADSPPPRYRYESSSRQADPYYSMDYMQYYQMQMAYAMPYGYGGMPYSMQPRASDRMDMGRNPYQPPEDHYRRGSMGDEYRPRH